MTQQVTDHMTDQATKHSPPESRYLEVRELRKVFSVSSGWRTSADVVALDGISFSIKRGETFGLIGESGSGKSTTGRIILGLEEPTSGQVIIDGTDTATLSKEEFRRLRQRVQVVFQDSGSAFNPRLPVGTQVGAPLRRFNLVRRGEDKTRVLDLLEQVGMEPSHYDRYIHEFSGGQRQRLGIARALTTNPKFLVLDEPTAALDVSVQAQVLNLLKDLQAERGLTMLLITHHLALVEHMCDTAGVLYNGQFAEQGSVDELLRDPGSEVTRSLLDAVLEPRA
ncbi:ATP-binding cassette domain-containing protein [Citricoccus sp. GCM10030269]|uniref:ATP-binding cassette domain-containing protein n=1 Tax=Citricoccus sp. GCM10030269 TaxID=3273388 RepID=UPI0036086CBA